jgi:hypothetical protein
MINFGEMKKPDVEAPQSDAANNSFNQTIDTGYKRRER